jgi:hypothetical protein
MTLRKSLRSAALVLVTVVAACAAGGSVLTGCSSTAGPLRSFAVKGQPIVTDAGVAVVPGQSEDATTYVINSSADPVTLISASLMPVAGFPTATLKHVAVNTTRHIIGVGTNWPPGTPVRAFEGAQLPHGESTITFAISGQNADVNYATAGLKITYRYQGQEYNVIAWSAVLACVTTAKNVNNPAECGDKIVNHLMSTVIKMAG